MKSSTIRSCEPLGSGALAIIGYMYSMVSLVCYLNMDPPPPPPTSTVHHSRIRCFQPFPFFATLHFILNAKPKNKTTKIKGGLGRRQTFCHSVTLFLRDVDWSSSSTGVALGHIKPNTRLVHQHTHTHTHTHTQMTLRTAQRYSTCNQGVSRNIYTYKATNSMNPAKRVGS